MKRIFAIIILLTAVATTAAAQKRNIHVFAHRGCWSKTAINNGITYLLTDRILPTGNRKKIKTRH